MPDWTYQPARDAGLKPAERLRSTRRESGLISTAGHWLWWSAMRCYLSGYHGLRIEGREHLPAACPFILVANHASHLDAMVLASPFPLALRDHVYPVAAGDTFFQKPLMTLFAASLLNALPVWRKKTVTHALQDLRRRLLEEPCGFILFPEGTRSRTGRMGPFKPGVGMLVAGTAVPVVPAYLDGAFDALPPDGRFPRPRRLTLRVGPALRFDDAPDDRRGWQRVAEEAEAAVRALADLAS